MAGAIILAAEAWVVVGLAVAVAFVVRGVGRLDPNARGAYAFRPLLVPGIALLWPLVLWRWLTAGRARVGDPPRRLQDLVALALSVAIPVILVTALLAIETGPRELPSERLAPPPDGPAGDGPAGDGPAGDGPAGDGPAGDGR